MLKINKLGLFFASCLWLSSCGKDFLEVAPKGSLIASKTSEYENMLYNSLSIGFDVPSIALGDEVAAINTYYGASSLRFQRLFQYQATIYDAEETASELQYPVRSIYIYNKIINEIMESDGGTQEQKLAIKAEAKASRAFMNMILVNYYGKPYNASTAAQDPGIPLITLADVGQTSFTRVSVQTVYDSLIADLKESIPLMSVEVPHRLRTCKAAAEFTLAKVYWFMGDYKQALEWIEEGKKHQPTSYANRIYDYNQTYQVANWVVSSGYNNEQSLMSRVSSSTWATTSNEALVAPWVIKLFTPNDQRLKSFSNIPYLGTDVFNVPDLKRRVGPFGSQVPQGIYLPDVELMYAECAAREGDLTKAQNILVAFRKLRMPDEEATVASMDQPSMIRFIVEERVRELALYGWRWFDMRRLSNDPLFQNASYAHSVYSQETGEAIETYPLPTERMTLRLPISVINANPGMENNP